MDFQTLIQWNCNGYYSHIEEIKLLMQQLNPLIFCLQETHFPELHIPKMKNYNMYYKNFTPSQRARGGVATLVNKNTSSKEIVLNTNFQAIAVSIHFPIKICVCNIYIPPHQLFTKQELLDLIKQLPKPMILCGDFNAHNELWGSGRKNRNGSIIESAMDYLDLNIFNNSFSPTHFSSFNGSFSFIDLTITSPELQYQYNWKTHTDLCSSDHFPIILTSLQKILTSKRPKWLIDKADWHLYQTNLNFDNITNEDVNISCEQITNAILQSAELSIPKSSHTPKRPPVPWWSKEISQSIKNRNKSLRTFKQYPTEENLQHFRIKKAQCRKLIRESKKKSWNNFVSTLDLNISSTVVWKKIRSFKALDSPHTIISLLVNDRITYDIPTILQELGTYFQSTFSSDNYSTTFIQYKNSTPKINLDSDLLLDTQLDINKPFTLFELNSAIAKSKGSSPGHDNIHYHMIKYLTASDKIKLLSFYNSIWSQNNFPETWRHSLIVPIAKPNCDHSLTKSFRPICLSSCLSKTMQRMVSSRLMWELENRKLLLNNQYGFRKNRSTMDCLIILEKKVLETFAKNHHMLSIFFYIEKAYDTAWKDNIIQTLIDWNLRGNILHFVHNFLSNRTFQVMIGNNRSNHYIQENGVPQGEILSVVLFLISINSIISYIPRCCNFTLFADDLTVSISSTNLTDCTIKLNETLRRLQDWCNKTGFKFSQTKTKGIHFTRKRKYIILPQVLLNNTSIEFVDTHKYLGLM